MQLAKAYTDALATACEQAKAGVRDRHVYSARGFFIKVNAQGNVRVLMSHGRQSENDFYALLAAEARRLSNGKPLLERSTDDGYPWFVFTPA